MNIETERKYIIKMPDFTFLQKCDNYTASNIEQIYLDIGFSTHRIRKRAYEDKTVYTETKKIRISTVSAIEEEGEISSEKYNELKKKQLKGTEKLEKTRHSFSFCGYVFEIDVYPQWKKSAIMEIELESEDTTPEIPSFIKIIREVTGIREYSNAKMSHAFPPEISE